MQGMRRPMTPMGMSVLRRGADNWLEAFGFGPSRGYMVDIAGRMFLDLTGMIRDRRMRKRLPRMLGIYGPGVAHAAGRLLEDPRLATRPGRAIDYTIVARVIAKLAPGLVVGVVRSWSIRPRPDVAHTGKQTASKPRHHRSRRQWTSRSRLSPWPRMLCSAGR
jgi:hypothetical protein